MPEAELAAELDRIRAFEQMLVDDGAVLVKLWFHLSKKAPEEAASRSSRRTSSPGGASSRQDWKNFARYNKFRDVSELVLRETSTGAAPWLVIDGSDPNYRALSAGRAAARGDARTPRRCQAKGEGTRRQRKSERRRRTGELLRRRRRSRCSARSTPPASCKSLKFEERLSKEKYATKIVKCQAKLGRAESRSPKMKKHSVVAVFEGMDAAGKGGAIRRVTQAIDARQFDVIPIAAPTDEERAQPYSLALLAPHPAPRTASPSSIDPGTAASSSSASRGFATENAWSRAYLEINEFEEQLAEHGIVAREVLAR